MTTLSKGQLRCFHCRKASPAKEGNWHHWNDQQVFLCKPCDRETQLREERPQKADGNTTFSKGN